MKKRTISVLLALSCVFALFVGNAGAVDNSEVEGIEYSEEIVKEVDELFENKDKYQVVNGDGDDITSDFFERNTKKYNNGDINSIIYELSSEGLTIVGQTTYSLEGDFQRDGGITPRYIVGVTARKQLTSCAKIVNKAYTFKYYVCGSYKVNDGNLQIMEVTSRPAFDPTRPVECKLDSCDSAYIIDGGGSYTLSADKKSVRFSGNLTIQIVSGAVAGMVQNTPVKYSFTGYGNGNAA